MTLFAAMRVLHIIGGFVSPFIFWVPIVTKKGGKIHRRTGWIYVAGMTTVSVSALYMGIFRVFDPHTAKGEVPFSLFLIFISILSGATAYYGIRVLKNKRRKDVHKYIGDLVFSFLLVISAIITSIYGFIINFPLLAWFPFLGIFLGGSQLVYWLRKPTRKMHWWFEHFIGMLSCSIATITAFTVFGGPRLFQIESVSILLWFLPTIILTPVIIGFSIYYGRKFNVNKRKNIPPNSL